MPISERRELCKLLGISYESTIKNPPSSFELLAIDILIAAGYSPTSNIGTHLLKPDEFIFQYPVNGFRVDLAFKDRLVELYGCKYHGCATCGYKKPTQRLRDKARVESIHNYTKLPVEIIWGHNTEREISRRLVGRVVQLA